MLIKKIISWLVLAGLMWLVGLGWFMTQVPGVALANAPKADAIIVLTGGAGRLDAGLQLLADHKAAALFISGVSEKTTLKDLLRTSSVKLSREQIAEITLGGSARNTIGNAEETRQWLEGKAYRTLLIVTSNYHMPRSLSELSELLSDYELIAYPVISDDANRELLISEYHKFLAGKLRHWVIAHL